MAYRKYRLSGTKIAAGLTITFIIGFFLAYNIANIQNSKQELTQQTLQPTITTQAMNTAKLSETIIVTTRVAAVSPQGEGVIGDVEVELEPGEGKVLVNTNPFIEPDTQFSAVTAVDIAKKITGQELNDKNVIIDFNINGTVIGGPSAGAAMTVATIAAIEDKQIKDGVIITGTVQEDGTVGKVGGILEKGNAALENGYKKFLIPKGQNVFTYYERQTTKREMRGYIYQSTKLVPKTVNLKEYFQDKGLEVIEVSNIEEVISYML
ncbi:MAG: S16 family serine protease [Candidatus Nanoarchaeia archaeon]